MDGPSWSTVGVSRTFFGRRGREWILTHFSEGHVLLDGVPVQVPRRASNDMRHWRLVDVEQYAHALAQNGFLTIDKLVRVINQIRIIAEAWGYVEPTPIQTRVETFDPTRQTRQAVYAVSSQEDLTDDLDGSPDAVARSFALGDIEYHLDLTESHWNDLVGLLGPYMAVARQNLGRGEDMSQRADRTEIRRWALRNGMSVGGRGPLPKRVIRAYLSRGDST